MRRRLVVVVVAVAAAVGMAGCTDPSPERPEPAQTQEPDESEPEAQPEPEPQFAEADVTHAQQLIVAHRTSLELHEIIRSKADITDEVNILSLSLHTTHDEQVRALEQMLTDWGEPVPGTDDADGSTEEGADDDAAADDDDGAQDLVQGGDVVVSDEQIRELGRASGQRANAMYLEHMIALHQARSAIAEDQILEGENPELVDLAQTMLTSQQHDLTHMRELLAGLDVDDTDGNDADGNDADSEDPTGTPEG